jgi:fatty-acyl-CoA synthase
MQWTAKLGEQLHASELVFAPVLEHARAKPDQPFLVLELASGVHVLTYRELVERAQRYAAVFRRRGVAPDDLVGFMLVTHAALAPAFLGAILAGAVPSLFPAVTAKQDPNLFWSSHRQVFRRLAPALIATDAANHRAASEHLAEFASRIVDLDAELSPEGIEPGLVSTRSATAFLQHSSGTTGLKKGVMLSHRAVLDSTAALAYALDLSPDDVIVSWLPLYHDMGLIGCFVLPMLCGLTTVHLNPLEWALRPQSLLDAIARHRGTLCWMPNFGFHHIMRTTRGEPRWDLSSLRALIDCSEPCKPETLRQFRARFAGCGLTPATLQVSYAMAENVFGVTQTDIHAEPRTLVARADLHATEGRIAAPEPGQPSVEFVSAGPPIPGTRVSIVDASGRALPDRSVGQIAITSPYLFSGYYGMPTPAEKFRDGWYMTGDLGFMDGGEVFVCGRVDDLLIINGRNIYAHDVEYAINKHTTVKPGRCIAIAPYNPRLGSQSLVLIAELDDLSAPARQQLIRAAQTVIETEFGTTAFDVHVTGPGWLIKTTSGKISREGNAKKYLAERPIT